MRTNSCRRQSPNWKQARRGRRRWALLMIPWRRTSLPQRPASTWQRTRCVHRCTQGIGDLPLTWLPFRTHSTQAWCLPVRHPNSVG